MGFHHQLGVFLWEISWDFHGIPWQFHKQKWHVFDWDIFEYSWYDTIMCAANIHMVSGNGRIANIYIYLYESYVILHYTQTVCLTVVSNADGSVAETRVITCIYNYRYIIIYIYICIHTLYVIIPSICAVQYVYPPPPNYP